MKIWLLAWENPIISFQQPEKFMKGIKYCQPNKRIKFLFGVFFMFFTRDDKKVLDTMQQAKQPKAYSFLAVRGSHPLILLRFVML